MDIECSSGDMDNELLQKLNTMGTRDREDLLDQFQSIVGTTQMSRGGCAFYLEMGNWNLQTALGAYYDVMSSSEKLPLFTVVEESSHIGENSVQPNHSFLKSWRFRNIGNDSWPNNLKLKFVGGENFSHGECAALPPLDINATIDISITMIAPFNEGYHQGHWRVTTLSGTYCGITLSVIVNVDKSNIGSLTKQMSSLGTPTQPMSTPTIRPELQPTPFCSPTGYGIFGDPRINTATNGSNEQLPIINEGMNVNMDEQELAERTAQLLQHENNHEMSDRFPNHFNS